MPLPVPIPPSPDASKALLAAFAERGIDWHPQTLVRGLDPARQVAMLGDGAEMPYDLFLGVPTHRVPEVVAQSGMTVDGWIPVNPMTLETQFPGVYAVGDVTSVGTPKAGVFAEGQAAVAADGISARDPRRGRSGALRRARHLLPRVRPQPGGEGRRHVRERAGAARLRSKAHRPRSSPTRPTSVPVACSAGSVAPGPESTLAADPTTLIAGPRTVENRAWDLRARTSSTTRLGPPD